MRKQAFIKLSVLLFLFTALNGNSFADRQQSVKGVASISYNQPSFHHPVNTHKPFYKGEFEISLDNNLDFWDISGKETSFALFKTGLKRFYLCIKSQFNDRNLVLYWESDIPPPSI